MAFFFLFKQKTAYEMRISDWSSDVCSSDLKRAARHRIVDHREPLDAPRDPIAADRFDGHPRLWRQPPLGTVVGVHEQYHAIVIHPAIARSEEHTSELQSLMRISYAVFCLQKKNTNTNQTNHKCNVPRTHLD